MSTGRETLGEVAAFLALAATARLRYDACSAGDSTASLSTIAVKGLTTNSQTATFPDLDMLSTPPTISQDNGVWDAGSGGITAPYRIKMFPYGEGAPGAQFRMRVFGWDHIGVDVNTLVWWPYLLAEYTCTLCTRGGPPAPVPGQPAYPRRSHHVARHDPRDCWLPSEGWQVCHVVG